jgi:hypothetical protein
MPDPTRAARGPDGRTALWYALLGVLALDHLALGLTSTGGTRALGIAGAMLIAAGLALAITNRPLAALGVISLGAIPLAVHTWWSIVTPALGSLTIAIALALAWQCRPGESRARAR